MFVPFITTRMQRRAGGGGGGGGGGSAGGGSKGGSGSTSKSGSGTGSSSSGSGGKGSNGGSSSGSSGSSSSGKASSVSAGGTSKAASSYSKGGGSTSTIPSGQLFAGRSIGGGTRDQVFGTKSYGSGYPGISGRGVAGRGFPFYYWPVVWGGAGAGTAAYLHSDEYGLPDNSSRPGGPMVSVTFNSSAGDSSTFHVVSDNTTVTNLISDITGNCSSLLNTSSAITTITYNASDASAPQPEQVIQYYRASSVYLTLDGYNTAVFESENATDVPLPAWVNTTVIDCLNQTIGAAVPLVDADTSSSTSSSIYSSPTGGFPYSNDAAIITYSPGSLTLTLSWILLCFASCL